MTEKRLRELFKIWQTRLGLDRWDLVVQMGGLQEEDSFMEIMRHNDYDGAIIFVQPWVLTGELPPHLILGFEPDEQGIERKIVHELLHCHTGGMRVIVDEFLDGQLHRDVHTMAKNSFKHEEEHAIETLAKALVESWT